VRSRPAGTPGDGPVPAGTSGAATADALDWSWPPYAPLEAAGQSFDTAEWAPASVVRHPRLRVGRWTVLYRRSA
jgi:hypothetical protein